MFGHSDKPFTDALQLLICFYFASNVLSSAVVLLTFAEFKFKRILINRINNKLNEVIVTITENFN